MRTPYFACILAVVCFLNPIVAPTAPITVLPPARTPPGATAPAATAYRDGLEALIRNDLVAAERAFASAVQADAKYAPALLGRAEVAARRKQLDAVAMYLTEAAQMAPRDAHVQASLGRYHAMQRDYAKAEIALRTAVEVDSRLTSARMDLADLYTTVLHQPDKAIALYRQTIADTPTHAGAHYALGIALADRDTDEARRALTEAARLEKSNPLAAIALARLSLQQNQPEQALQWADAALRIDASAVGAALLRTDALFAQRQPSAALSELRQLAARQPKNPDIQFRLAAGFHRAGKLTEAFAAYRTVVELAPRNAVAWNNLAALALDLGEAPADALQWARRATALAPDDAQFRDTLGWALWKAGNRAAALDELRAASKAAPNDAGVWYHVGVVYADANRNQEAVSALDRALQVDANFFGAADARARLAALK